MATTTTTTTTTTAHAGGRTAPSAVGEGEEAPVPARQAVGRTGGEGDGLDRDAAVARDRDDARFGDPCGAAGAVDEDRGSGALAEQAHHLAQRRRAAKIARAAGS